MTLLPVAALFFITALAEIVGCYLPYAVLRQNRSPWLLLPAACSLIAFAYLLTLHPEASGRIYAAYGAIYITTAFLWLRFVDGVQLNAYDWGGAGIVLVGMAVMVYGWNNHP